MTGDSTMATSGSDPIAQLEWRQLTERHWADLVDRGLPVQLGELIHDLGERNERRIRPFTLPTMRAGIEGLAVPFISEDGIVFDPSLLDQPDAMTRVVARELSVTVYPGWSTSRPKDYDEMQAFASELAGALLDRLPQRLNELDSMVEEALGKLRS
jgi:hypothetical protein